MINPWEKYGSTPQRVQVRPADPKAPYEGPKAGADLESTNLSNQQKRIAIEAAERGALPTGYRWKADGSGAEPIPGLPIGVKSLSESAAVSLEDQINVYASLKQAALGFEDDFGGNTLTGEVENWAQAVSPWPVGTPGQRDWWSAFREADNVIRNQLFGSALTESEKQAYAQTTISPRMRPDEIRKNIVRRAEIIRGATERRIDRYRAAGFNESEIEALAGEYSSDFGLGQPREQRAQPFVLPKAAGVKKSAPLEVEGATGKGGLAPIPELRGIENDVINMIGKGASTGQVVDFLDEKLAPHGAFVDGELASHLGGIVRKHKANPSQPVRSLGEGWDILWHRRVPDSESNAVSRFADTDTGNFLMNTANSMTAGLPAYLAGKQDVLSAANEERPLSAIAGNLAGGIAALGGISKIANVAGGRTAALLNGKGGIGGDVLYNTIQGGVEGGPQGAALGATAGLGGNLVGSGVTSGAGKLLRGSSDKAVKFLSENGVPLSPRMITNRTGKDGGLLGAVENMPFVKHHTMRRQQDAEEGVFRAALNDSVSGLGGKVKGVGPEGMAEAYKLSDDAYARALGGRQFQINDPQYMADMNAAMAKGEAIPRLGEEFTHAMNKDIAPLFDENGMMSGERLQDAIQLLRNRRASYKGDPLGTDIGSAFSDAEASLRGLATRQSPDVIPQLDLANEAYRKINILADASLAATNRKGIPTAAQIARASTSNTRKYGGKRAAATGNRPFQELTDAAQEVIPAPYGDPGTASRWAGMVIPAALGLSAGGAGYAGAGPALTAPLLAAAALTSRPSARVFQKVMTGDRPQAVADLGEFLIRNRRKTGIFGAAAAGTMVPQLTQ